MKDVTFVVTSCGRMDLLDETLKSLFETDWDDFDSKILVEDSGDVKYKKYIEDNYGDKFDILIFNDKNIGKLKSIDKAYSQVKTKYIFHCEDDWFFYRKGFIDDSLAILNGQEDVSMVNLRSYYWDLRHNSQFELKEREEEDGVFFYSITDMNSINPMTGFCLNPGLRRLDDLLELGRLDSVGAEYLLSKAFIEKGKHMVLIENAAIDHIGWGQGLEDPGKQPLFYKKIKNIIKAILNMFGAKYHLIN